jgi:protein involved in polysaccharide export with SLBB domain
MRNHSWRWLLFCLVTILFGCPAWAADTNSAARVAASVEIESSTNVFLSAPTPTRKAPWQQHLTLGAGDVLNFSMFLNDAIEQPRENVVIGPDGRISYLQAQDVMAAGLTIDELRARLDAELGKYYRSPKTIVTPVAIRSKKYFVLGAVVNKGVFAFDRPLTVIEAIGRAGGLQTGVFERNTVELADLPHSFLVRNGQRVPVDFERLFQNGELSQNIPLEPNDYLYFASASANEVYVLGEVAKPGVVNYTPRSSAIAAITERGGFTPTAYKQKVLIVRGSLNHPQTFVVDTAAILKGKAPDFKLQPRDIVYVSQKPWQIAEDLLDTAVTSFVQGAVITFTGVHAGPLITEPLFH